MPPELSDDSEGAWLIVGRAGKPHGVHGDILVDIITDFPERLTDGLRFGVGGEDGPTEFHEAFRVRYHKGRWLLSVAGLRDRDAIEPLRGRFLFLPALALDELPEGYHYEHQLVGLECVSTGGESLGTVTALDPGAGGQRRRCGAPLRTGRLVSGHVDADRRRERLRCGVLGCRGHCRARERRRVTARRGPRDGGHRPRQRVRTYRLLSSCPDVGRASVTGARFASPSFCRKCSSRALARRGSGANHTLAGTALPRWQV